MRVSTYGLVVVLLLTALATTAEAQPAQTELYSPDSMLVNCSGNCSFEKLLGGLPIYFTDQSLNITCLGDPDDYPVCNVHRKMSNDGYYNNSNPPCNLSFTCECQEELIQLQTYYYPGTVQLLKLNETIIDLNITVDDYSGEEFMSWTKKIYPGDLIDLTFSFEFACPHKTVSELTLESCLPFYEQYAEGESLLTFQSIMALSGCSEELVNVEAEFIACNNELKTCQVDLAAITQANDDAHARLAECQNDAKTEKETLEASHYQYTLKVAAEKVDSWWSWVAVLLGLSWVVFFFYHISRGGWDD